MGQEWPGIGVWTPTLREMLGCGLVARLRHQSPSTDSQEGEDVSGHPPLHGTVPQAHPSDHMLNTKDLEHCRVPCGHMQLCYQRFQWSCLGAAATLGRPAALAWLLHRFTKCLMETQ